MEEAPNYVTGKYFSRFNQYNTQVTTVVVEGNQVLFGADRTCTVCERVEYSDDAVT